MYMYLGGCHVTGMTGIATVLCTVLCAYVRVCLCVLGRG